MPLVLSLGAWQLAGCYPVESPAAIRRAALIRPAAGLGGCFAGPPASLGVFSSSPSKLRAVRCVVSVWPRLALWARPWQRCRITGRRGRHQHDPRRILACERAKKMNHRGTKNTERAMAESQDDQE